MECVYVSFLIVWLIQVKLLKKAFLFSIFSVQDPISNLAFEADLPKTYVDVGQGVFRIQAKVDKGTSLRYTFTVVGPTGYNESFLTNTSNYYKYTAVALQELQLGKTLNFFF